VKDQKQNGIEDADMPTNDIDIMPRPLALTFMIGSLAGGSFWAALIAVALH
jgi:hypothetical protein